MESVSSTFNSARQLFRVQGVMLALVALMFLIFFAQEVFDPSWYESWMAVPAEVEQSVENFRGGTPAAADWREMATLLSYSFLHASIEHVGNNMLFFWIFGALLVELLGVRWMLLLFFFTAIAASATHIALNRGDMVPMLGASGVVTGFEGAYLGLAVRWRLPDPHVWPIAHPIPPARLAIVAIIGVAIDYYSILSQSDSNVAYGAHIGGFTAGLVIAALAAPRPRGARVVAR